MRSGVGTLARVDWQREGSILWEYLKGVVTRGVFIVLTLAAGVAWLLGIFGIALGWVALVLVLVGIVPPQYLTYRKVRLTEKPPSVSIARLDDLQMGDRRLARISVRNAGTTTEWFRARVPELQGFDGTG